MTSKNFRLWQWVLFPLVMLALLWVSSKFYGLMHPAYAYLLGIAVGYVTVIRIQEALR